MCTRPVFTFTPHRSILRRFKPLNEAVHLFGFEVIKTSADGHIEYKSLRYSEFKSGAQKFERVPRLYIFAEGFSNAKL